MMPANGGRSVTDLNTGTANRQSIPIMRMLFWRGLLKEPAGMSDVGEVKLNLPVKE